MPTKSKSEGRTRSKSPARSKRASRSRSRSRSRGRSPARQRKAKQSPSPARKTRESRRSTVEKIEAKSETAQTTTVQKTEVVKKETVVVTPTRQSSATTPTRQSARIAAIQTTKETGTVTTVKTEALDFTKKRSKTRHFELWTLGAALFIVFLPISTIYLRLECNRKDCSLAGLRTLPTVPKTVDRYFNLQVAGVTVAYIVFQALFAMLPLGRVVEGQPLATGDRLKYRCSGFLALLLSVGLWGALVRFAGVPATYVYDHWIHFVSVATVIGFLLSICAFVKSRKASKKELTPGGNTGNVIYDFFMGRELNPRFFGGRLDVKVFVVTRMYLITWALVDLGFLLKAYQTDGTKLDRALVLIVALQLFYIADILWFEDAYFTTIDVLHEGMGYMMIMACFLLPFLYSLQALYIYQYPKNYNIYLIAGLVALDLIGYVVMRGSNGQKDQFRKNPYDPALSHLESMPTQSGKRLLVSGWWGLCRNPNYLGDLLQALAWALTCGLTPVVPHLIFLLLLTLLVHRLYRAHDICHKKYGQAWDRYCQRVPYRIIPYVY